MGFFTTYIMLVTEQVDFSIKLKQALRKVGQYDVTPFTSPTNALDYLRKHHQDVVLIDATLLDLELEGFVTQLREIIANIGILIGPDNPDVRWQAQNLDARVIEIPCTVRQLLPHLQAIELQQYDQVPDTTHPQPLENQPDTSVIQSPPSPSTQEQPTVDELTALEFVVSDDGEKLVQVTQGTHAQPELGQESDKAIAIFHRLAAEEPPMPTFEESGTVHDLVSGVTGSNLHKLIEAFSETEVESEAEVQTEDGEDRFIPATLILETTNDDSTPLEAFSLTDFLKRIDYPGIQPLPSWIQESERFVREPDFLPEQLPGFSQPLEYTSAVTQGAAETIESEPENLPTDPITPQVRSRPIHPGDLTPPPTLPESESFTKSQPTVSDEDVQNQPAPPPGFLPEETTGTTAIDEPLAVPELSSEVLLLSDEPGDPRMAQLALTLTQVSLELTAEATLLAKNGQIVAYAGSMADDDLENIRQVIADDWETVPEQSRIRFINLPSNGADYMLYSRRTDDGFTLSMVFAGTMPLRVIRRQSKRLSDALATVPEIMLEPDEEDEAEPERDVPLEIPEMPTPAPHTPPTDLTYTSMTAVWLLNDVEQPLTSVIAQTLADELHQQLLGAFWRIQGLQVHPDYVYLQAEFPGEASTTEIMRELLQTSAAIVVRDGGAANPKSLWADSYLVVTPGRDISDGEIQQFIQFVRM